MKFNNLYILVVAASLLSVASCTKSSEQTPSADPEPVIFDDSYIFVTLHTRKEGRDMLALDDFAAVYLPNVVLSYGDAEYRVGERPDEAGLALRLTTSEGSNALAFGPFNAADNYHDAEIFIDWGDNTSTDLSFDLYIEGRARRGEIRSVGNSRPIDEAGYLRASLFRNSYAESHSRTYRSTDFSADGQWFMLQKASVGRGVDIVVMGDAYTDRLVTNGVYISKMREATDAFFSEEPYASLRELFNVYCLVAVSKSEGIYDGAQTALGVEFGEGTLVLGDAEKVLSYLYNIDDLIYDIDRFNELTVVVLVNELHYGGTCAMYGPYSWTTGSPLLEGDYGRGVSFTYSSYTDPADLQYTVTHEASGHGFAKLADEYYSAMTPADSDTINYINWAHGYGYDLNVDVSGSIVSSPWAYFGANENYASEGIGYFQGGSYCSTGVWRSTYDSYMRGFEGGFNAVSRYAAWRRINRLAFGQEVDTGYEAFTEWDMAHRTRSAATRTFVLRPYTSLHAPVKMSPLSISR